MSKNRCLGVVGVMCIIVFLFLLKNEPKNDGAYHRFEHKWFLNAIIIAWLSFSVGHKLLLILDIKSEFSHLVAGFALLFFGFVLLLGWLAPTAIQESKKTIWQDLPIFPLLGFVFIDILPCIGIEWE